MRPRLVPTVLTIFAAAAACAAPPAPLPWQSDLAAAREAANREGKPLLVLFRCPQSKIAGAVDARLTRPDDAALAALLARRFVPVKLTSIKGVDLGTFRFDYDLTLAALVLDGRDGAVLARWGTHEGGYPLPALRATLERAAGAYAARKPLRTQPASPKTIADLYPSFAATKRAGGFCYHCHYVNDAAVAEGRQRGTFRKADLYAFPPPENAGLTLGGRNVVAAVAPASAAARAGVRAGDAVTAAGATPVYGAADLTFALNAVSDPGRVTLQLRRDGKPISATLDLPAGWRKTDISWRPSQGAVPPILGIWEEQVTPEERAKLGIPAGRLALRITTLFAGPKWEPTHAGLEKGDVIVAVGGEALPDLSARQFHSHVRLNCEVGGTIPLTVLREGKRVEVAVPALDVSLE